MGGKKGLLSLNHATAQDLEQYVSGLLSDEDSSVVHQHLENCEECQNRLAEIAIQAQWKGAEGRREPRVPVNFSGRLKWLDPVTSVGPPHDVQIIEISRTGLKILTPRYLIPKTLIQIHFNGKAMLGKVVYCEKSDSGYQAGIRQVEDFLSA